MLRWRASSHAKNYLKLSFEGHEGKTTNARLKMYVPKNFHIVIKLEDIKDLVTLANSLSLGSFPNASNLFKLRLIL